jgi:tetraacyldisaccharide 4'-kinase
MREPQFWWRKDSLAARLLAPAGALYGAVARTRLAASGRQVAAPVICIGNLVLGGAGKTPTAIAIALLLHAMQENPVFLTRGYGGKLRGPTIVDPVAHRAGDVGDEPLLLAQAAPTIVARKRVEGAKAAIAAGASVIVMDDGFQNPSLHKHISLLVVDALRAVGNGRVFPAGPLRAPLLAQLRRADALVLVGKGEAAAAIARLAERLHMPVFTASLQAEAAFIAALGSGRVLAFAGIGNPHKFFATLADTGVAVGETKSFPDHHFYTRAEARALCARADADGLVLVTTEKDMARLRADTEVAELAAQAHALPVKLVFQDEKEVTQLLGSRLATFRRGHDRRSSAQAS